MALGLGWSMDGAGLGCALALLVVGAWWCGRTTRLLGHRVTALAGDRDALRTALEASEHSRLRIVDFALDGAVGTDRDGRILTWNRRAETLFGRRFSEVKGQFLHRLILPAGSHETYLTTLRTLLRPEKASQPVHRSETTALYRDGQEFTVELTVLTTGLTSEAGTFIIFVRDISDRMAAAEQMRMAKDSAEGASRAKSEFLANMSHELRTPMNAVVGMAELLTKTPLDPEQREFVDNLRRGADHLMGVIGDVLDLSRIEAGKLTLSRLEFDVRTVVSDVAGLLAYRVRDRGLTLEVQTADDVPDRLCGDEGRLRQILTNLVANAIKFTDKGKISVAITCIERLPDRAILRFRVDDTGIGIDEHTLGRLFQKFTQADGSTTRRYGGTGLGLSICRQLVELMEGRLGATSTPSHGSSFWFEIPLALAAMQESPEAGETAARALRQGPPPPAAETGGAKAKDRALIAVYHGNVTTAAPPGPVVAPPTPAGSNAVTVDLSVTDPTSSPHVLVVDDNAMNLLLLKRILEKMGCKVDQADGGKPALALVEKFVYEVVFLDCQMPDMDGYEVVRRIRLRPTHPEVGSPCYVPVVGVTAGALPGDRDKCLDAGMDDYIPKPISLDIIASALARWKAVNEQRTKDLHS